MSGNLQSIVIRPCVGFDELKACVEMQIAIWGYDARDVFPLKAFLVAQKIGGQVIGAFDLSKSASQPQDDATSLVGFVLAWPGLKPQTSPDKPPRPYLHSHMLAVQEEYRNSGLGTRLKFAQRTDALSRGINHIEWTFDPLEIKNAFLNIHKLGARCRRYEVDFYGASSSRLQAGLPTDRLFAEWTLDSPSVCSRFEGAVNEQTTDCNSTLERVIVPVSIYNWKQREPKRALTVLLENRMRFQQAFSRGLAVVGYSQDQDGNGIYELGVDDHS